MRVLLCKLHCPFMCFCKPSSHLLAPCPLKLEGTTPTVLPSSVSSVPAVVTAELPVEKAEVEKVGGLDGSQEVVPKSSLKKSCSQSGERVEKGKVKWMDLVGKELVQIREFEQSESGDSEEEAEGVGGCFCVIQ